MTTLLERHDQFSSRYPHKYANYCDDVRAFLFAYHNGIAVYSLSHSVILEILEHTYASEEVQEYPHIFSAYLDGLVEFKRKYGRKTTQPLATT